MAFIAQSDSEARKRALLQNEQMDSAASGIIGGLKSLASADLENRKRALLAQEKQQERIDKANAAEALANEKTNSEMRKQEFERELFDLKSKNEADKQDREFKFREEEGRKDREARLKQVGMQASLKPPVKTEAQKLIDLEKETSVKSLASSSAGILPIKNELDTFLKNSESYTPDQLLIQGKQLIKTLNSTQGKDAVGAEEAARLAGKLDFRLGNLFNSDPVQFGRDLPGFLQQVKDTSDKISGTITRNKQSIDQLTGQSVAPSAPQENPLSRLEYLRAKKAGKI
jgi:hypothetical protein